MALKCLAWLTSESSYSNTCASSLPTYPLHTTTFRKGTIDRTGTESVQLIQAPDPLITYIIMLHSNVDISLPPGPWTPNLPNKLRCPKTYCMHAHCYK
ncbi:uncharacterized protein RAG0_03324 [Rhynchosporium agropyri]|uniref:Uncharacterized protein n=1 Tax=Rhynchosporium agropyri TaxID=914238 RepID=A0A1E1K3Z6_9HELO|nr:uncharacterized protein RAG0_03324 [Rhynchosporium agropyri]